MKKICFIAIAMLGGLNVPAQTSVPAAPPLATRIDSDSADFNMDARTAIYRGNVRVRDPQMNLDCEWLVADLPQSGRINHIVAETNVVIDLVGKERMTHATGQKAVYDYNVENGATNETVTLTGNPWVKSVQGDVTLTNTADVIIWNRINNSFRFINPHTTIQDLNGLAGTNSPPANTNELIVSKTNLPPGTIENIDRVNVPSRGF